MGGGDSKQEEEDNKLNLVKNKDGISKKNTPKHSRKGSEENMKHSKNSSIVESRFFMKKDQKPGEQVEGLSPQKQASQDQNINTPLEQQLNAVTNSYFEDWNPQFHQAGKIHLKIMVLNIQPTFQFQHLNRQFSEHFAELSWQYEYQTVQSQRKTFLRFIIAEDGGYYLSFVVDEDANVFEGDQNIWALACPFRTIEQTTKVGNYKCERVYQSEKQEAAEDEQQGLDSQYFVKWEQKPPMNRPTMKQLLQNRRNIHKMQSEKGFQYRQTSKYFTNNNDWAFSVLVEEKFNSFKGWLIELDNSSNSKQRDKSSSMGVTLKNDIQNRQKMYIQQMRKKRHFFTKPKLSQ